ncbi:MAG: penicillin-binding protein activator LpoB [Lentisphaeria bacterium]|nr:penicillin-binding protein activator LpoB [Lentisphaeria bacterium]
MRQNRLFATCSTLAVLLLSGCAHVPENIDLQNDRGHAVMGLDYRDFDLAASQMVQSALASGTLKKPDGGRYVMATGKVVNDTMQRIDTDQLMAKIEEELMNSGQVVMTSAIGAGDATDDMVYEARELRKSDEFDAGTLAPKGRLVAPDLSVSGKIIQRDVFYDKRTRQVEYYFQLRITNLRTGLRFWQKETLIGKRGSNKSVSW